MAVHPASAPSSVPAFGPVTGGRLHSLDVFRGLTMIWMVSEGFGLSVFRDNPGFLGALAEQFDHKDWHGMNAWDLIQPFFMFIVGVAMPFSFSRRWAAGETWADSFGHVLRRVVILIGLGLIARSIQAGRPVIDVINVLAQVSITYLLAFLVLRKDWKVQAGFAFAIIAVHWAIYQFLSPGHPWSVEGNVGGAIDRSVFGRNWGGNYATINFIGSAFNTIIGAVAGSVLFAASSAGRKLRILVATGAGFLILGLALDPLIPINKKIWTSSFSIYSTGYCLLALAFFYWLTDVKGLKSWATIPVVVGANSIFIYIFHEVLVEWLHHASLTFTGWTHGSLGAWGNVMTACVAIAFQIYVCWWLYKRKILFKV